MTTSEFRKKIASSALPEWYNSVELTFSYSHIDFSVNLKGFSSIHKFLSQQINGWEKFDNLPNEFIQSKNHFTQLRNQLEQFYNSYSTQDNEQNLNSYWNNLRNQLIQNSNYFVYDNPITDFLIKLQNDYPNSFLSAYYYFIGQYRISNKNDLIGSILAYEYDLQKDSDILKRRKSEKSSFSKIKLDLRNQLKESETQLTEHLTNSDKKYAKYVEKLDTLKDEKDNSFGKWFNGNEENKGVTDIFKDWFEGNEEKQGVSKKIEELENTYKEKLKLSEPANYWETRAKSLKKQGWFAFAALIIFVGIVVWSLGELLWNVPDQIYSSFFGEDKSAAIRWSIIYVTFISFMAFAVRAITKVMFSSFHLARDCEERYTLTYFYLSLLKDTKVEESDRKLIMQSLFSRAETGLLKDDSGPKMPNDFVGKLFGN